MSSEGQRRDGGWKSTLGTVLAVAGVASMVLAVALLISFQTRLRTAEVSASSASSIGVAYLFIGAIFLCGLPLFAAGVVCWGSRTGLGVPVVELLPAQRRLLLGGASLTALFPLLLLAGATPGDIAVSILWKLTLFGVLVLIVGLAWVAADVVRLWREQVSRRSR